MSDAQPATQHEHEWRDTGFATVEDCECGATRSGEFITEPATAARRAHRWWLYDAPFAFGWASMGAVLGVIFGWWALLVIFGLSVFIVVAPIRYRGSNRD